MTYASRDDQRLIVVAAVMTVTVAFALIVTASPAVIIAPAVIISSATLRIPIVRMVFLPPVMIPVPHVIPVFDVTRIDDVPVPVPNQSRRKMARSDLVPWAIVVRSAVPHAPLGSVIIVVDIEETERNPDSHIETEVLRVEK